MLKLTRDQGPDVYLDPADVARIETREGSGSRVFVRTSPSSPAGEVILVQEWPSDVAAAIEAAHIEAAQPLTDLVAAPALSELRLGPKDALLVRLREPLSRETLENLRERLAASLKAAGITNPVLVAPQGVDLGVVRLEGGEGA